MVAGGAAFAGFKAFEDHQRSEGPSSPFSHTHHPILPHTRNLILTLRQANQSPTNSPRSFSLASQEPKSTSSPRPRARTGSTRRRLSVRQSRTLSACTTNTTLMDRMPISTTRSSTAALSTSTTVDGSWSCGSYAGCSHLVAMR
jgi:hypothetical protein